MTQLSIIRANTDERVVRSNVTTRLCLGAYNLQDL